MSDNSTNSPTLGQAGRDSSSEGCFSSVPTDVWQGCQKLPGCCQTHHVQPGYFLFFTASFAFPDLVETACLAEHRRKGAPRVQRDAEIGERKRERRTRQPQPLRFLGGAPGKFWDATHGHVLQVGTSKRDALTGECISASASPPNRLFLHKHWQSSRRSMWDPTPPLENMRSPGSRGRRGD